jgi:UDP-glucose 4-epimerase
VVLVIVVTGGSGFIGTHVCTLLLEKGYRVRIIDIAPPQFGISAEFVRASVLDSIRLQRMFLGAEAVIHLAALVDVQASIKDPFADFQVNVEGTVNVLEAARRAAVKKVIYASSAAVYGNPVQIPINEQHPASPVSPYGLSKLSAERYVLLYNLLYGMQNVALRLFNVYGTGQSPYSPYSGVVTKFASSLLSGKQPTIFGDGKQTRDFVHVSDAAGAFLLALNSGGFSTPINIASGKETSILELFGKMRSISGREVEPAFAQAKEGEIKRSVADISLAQKLLGFQPKVMLEDGLRSILAQ